MSDLVGVTKSVSTLCDVCVMVTKILDWGFVDWVVIVVLACFGYVLIRPVKKQPRTSMRPVKKQPRKKPSMRQESGDGMQLNCYRIDFHFLPSTTTPTEFEDMCKGPGFLGAEVVGNIFSGHCTGGHAYFEDKETAKAAIKKCIKLGLYVTLAKLDKPWSGFRRLSEEPLYGFHKVRCYGVGATDFGVCFKCGLPSHDASKCQTFNA